LRCNCRCAIRAGCGGKLGRTNLRERTDQAAEMLLTVARDEVEEGLLDRTTQVLHALPQRSPGMDEGARAGDAVNLRRFGVTGILQQMIQLCRSGGGVVQIAEGLEKREQ